MKEPDSKFPRRWEYLLREARDDAVPPVNLPAVLHAVRTAGAGARRRGWLEELTVLFAFHRVVPTCLTMAVLLGGIATWEAWGMWQALPWGEMIADSAGGAP